MHVHLDVRDFHSFVACPQHVKYGVKPRETESFCRQAMQLYMLFRGISIQDYVVVLYRLKWTVYASIGVVGVRRSCSQRTSF